MKLTLLIFFLFPLLHFAQKTYKQIELAMYVSNPPSSDYFCDTIKCEGECVSYFDNGALHMKGKFENGQLIDTLFTYYQSGVLAEVFVVKKQGWRMLKYFPTGQLSTDYNYLERSETEYYPSGKLKREYSWNRKFQASNKEYDELGNLILAQTPTTLKKFDPNGTIREAIKRKEVNVLGRMFSRDKSRFYAYTWDKFDERASKKGTIHFYGSDYSNSVYPNELREIRDYLFKEVQIYQQGEEHIKMDFQYRKFENELTKFAIISTKVNGEWKVEREILASEVYEIIEVQLR
jgi:antitoxin component YwqK of YwqJK toxin-antitoxin module